MTTELLEHPFQGNDPDRCSRCGYPASDTEAHPRLLGSVDYHKLEREALARMVAGHDRLVQLVQAAGGRVTYEGDTTVIHGDIDPHILLAEIMRSE